MEQTNKPDTDCGCDNGECCPPKRKPRWMMIVSILVLLLALSIIVIKVVNTQGGQANPNTTSGKASCCDTMASKDSTAKPCCPKN